MINIIKTLQTQDIPLKKIEVLKSTDFFLNFLLFNQCIRLLTSLNKLIGSEKKFWMKNHDNSVNNFLLES